MPHTILHSLLTGARQAADDQARVAARAAWASRTVEALMAAQRRADQAWRRLLSEFPEDLDDEELEALPPPPEAAEVDAMWAQIEAVREHDRWPPHLYWSL